MEEVHLKKTLEVLGRDSPKWKLFVDPNRRVQVFFQYSGGAQLNSILVKSMNPDDIRLMILRSLKYGNWLIIELMPGDKLSDVRKKFEEVHKDLWSDIISKKIVKPEAFEKLTKASDGQEYDTAYFTDEVLEKFRIIFVSEDDPDEEMQKCTDPFRIIT